MNDEKQIEMQNKINHLAHKLRVAEAESLIRLCSAHYNISNVGFDKYRASGVTLTIKNINQTSEVLIEEVLIADGLSPETIEAIKLDLERTYAQKMDCVSTGLKGE